MKKLILLLIFTLTLSAMAYGQETTKGEEEYVNVPVNVSLLPGVSMNKVAIPGQKIINNFNLNLLAGSAAKLEGVELGVLVNYYSEDVKGAQFVGLVNIVEGKTAGAQFAGILNLNGNEFIGAQFAGITNIVPENITGMQAAGITNIGLENMKGIQLAGITNIVPGNTKGAQIAGITNINLGTLEGAQIAGILNITDTVETGFQIGLLNYANESNGIPIGLVSYVKEDGLRADVWVDEAIFTNVGLRSGTHRFYNLLFAGKQVADPLSWTIGFGFGPHFPLGKSGYIETDLILQIIADMENLEDNSYMGKLRVIGGWKIRDYISIYAGPTYNAFRSKVNDGSDYALWTISEEYSDGTWKRRSIGFVLGVKVFR